MVWIDWIDLLGRDEGHVVKGVESCGKEENRSKKTLMMLLNIIKLS